MITGGPERQKVKAADGPAIDRAIKELAGTSKRGADVGQSRRCGLTLVVATLNAEQVLQTVDSLGQVYPCRACILLSEPGTGPVEAEVFARGSMEGVILKVPNEQREMALGILPGLLAADLPRVFWEQDPEALDPQTSSRLRGMCDWSIVDSAGMAVCREDYERLLNVVNEGHVSDINWSRLAAWRELTEQVLKTAPGEPGSFRHGPCLCEIHFVAECGACVPAASLLYAGWLANALGWHDPYRQPGQESMPASASVVRFKTADGCDVVVEFLPVALHGFDRRLKAVQLSSSADVMTFSIERSEDMRSGRVIVARASRAPLSRTVVLAPTSVIELLAMELGGQRCNPAYILALKTASEIAGLLERES